MRDINRIKPFLNKMQVLWEKYPDLRFAQLIDWILSFAESYDEMCDSYYWEDDKWEELMNKITATLQ